MEGALGSPASTFNKYILNARLVNANIESRPGPGYYSV